MTVKIIINHDDVIIGEFTLHENVAEDLLNGNIIQAELGGYDEKLFTYSLIKTKKD